MKIIEGGYYTGERALYDIHNVKLNGVHFGDGESPLKECSHLVIEGCTFSWKYPLWYGKNFKVNNSTFELMSRSGIWYVDNIEITNSDIICPKLFRRASNIKLDNVVFHEALETFWNCQGIKINNVKADKGDYMFFNCKDIDINNFVLNGNYAFDGAKNIKVKNSILNSKDAFWNSENVYVENCKIVGEYLGWNSKNLVFKDCEIESNQGFCYIEGLKLINCKLINTDLAFERCSNIDADIKSSIVSIKNPYSGVIKVESAGEIILDSKVCDSTKTKIILGNK